MFLILEVLKLSVLINFVLTKKKRVTDKLDLKAIKNEFVSTRGDSSISESSFGINEYSFFFRKDI